MYKPRSKYKSNQRKNHTLRASSKPWSAHQNIAVLSSLSRADTSAPCSSNVLIALAWPQQAATKRGVKESLEIGYVTVDLYDWYLYKEKKKEIQLIFFCNNLMAFGVFLYFFFFQGGMNEAGFGLEN